MEDSGQLVVPSPAACRVLCEWMKDENELKRVREEAALHQGARPEGGVVRPVKDGNQDAAQWLAFVPPEFYWSRRKKYGRGLFNTEAGLKDLKRHHPQFFPETKSGKVTSGWTPACRSEGGRRRVHFDRGTLQLAK